MYQLVLAAIGLTAISLSAQATPRSGTQQPIQSKPLQSVKWDDCGSVNGHKLECSRLDVPRDHFNRSSEESFSIPLIRLLASNASASGDKHIFLNPDGPGGSGVSYLLRAGASLNRVIGEGFNLISFDPRGVNASTPQALCYVDSKQRADGFTRNPWDVNFQAGEMFTQAENMATACTDTTGEDGAYINTPQTASDMNSILDAIGQEELYYWGFSYGSILGQTYAQMFPERVGKLIVDGSLIDTDTILDGFLDECFKAKNNCALNSIKGTAFSTVSDLQSYFQDYMKNLQAEPIPVYINKTNYGAVTRRSIVTNGIFPATYKPISWPLLAQTLTELLNGNPVPAFESYSDSWIAAILGDESNRFVSFNDCLETGLNAPFHGIKAIQNFTLSQPELSSLVSRYQRSDIFERASWSIPTTHTFRPQYYPEHPRFKTANPILVLSTTYDPVCPKIPAQKAHDSFQGAGFVEQKSYGHCTVSMPSLCMAKHVQRYFYDGILPEAGATCGIDVEYFPSRSDASAVKGLSQEDAELLSALQELALEDIL